MNEELIQPWLPAYIERMQTSLEGEGVTLDPVRGVQLTETVSDDSLRRAVTLFIETRERNKLVMLMMDRFVGQLIVAWADKHDSDWCSCISELDLVEQTGKSFKSLQKLPRIVSQVPDEMFHLPNMTTTMMDVVTSFSGPIDDYTKMRQFNDMRWKLLYDASAAPEEWPKAKMTNEMRRIQMVFDITPRRLIPLSFTMDRFMRTSIMLVNYTEADWERVGTTRADAIGYWETYRNELIERGRLDTSEDTLPWQDMPPPALPEEEEAPTVNVEATVEDD